MSTFISEFFKEEKEKGKHFEIIRATLIHEGFWGTLPDKPIPGEDLSNAKIEFDSKARMLTIEGVANDDWVNGNWGVDIITAHQFEDITPRREEWDGDFSVFADRITGNVFNGLRLKIRPF